MSSMSIEEIFRESTSPEETIEIDAPSYSDESQHFVQGPNRNKCIHEPILSDNVSAISQPCQVSFDSYFILFFYLFGEL